MDFPTHNSTLQNAAKTRRWFPLRTDKIIPKPTAKAGALFRISCLGLVSCFLLFDPLRTHLLATHSTTSGNIHASAKAMITEQGNIRLTGQIVSGEIAEAEYDSIKLTLKLRLDFKNTGAKPVLMLRREPVIVEERITSEATDGEKRCLLRREGYPSIDRRREWEDLRSVVDRQSPLASVIKILAPGEIWTLETTDWFHIDKKTSVNGDQSWAVISGTSTIWFQVTLESWPRNIERGDERYEYTFGKALRERWQSFGELRLESITSEPIPLDLSSLSLASTKNHQYKLSTSNQKRGPQRQQ